MPVNCPHCSKEVADVVPQATLTERINAKNAEIATLKSAVTELTPKAANYDAVVGERDKLKIDLTKATEGAARAEALGPALSKYTDAEQRKKVQSAFEVIYASETGDKPEAERPAFGELDKWAKTHPLLAQHFTAGSTTTTTPGAKDQPGTGDRKLPNDPAGKNGDPPPPQGKMTQTQVREYFASPSYRALPREEQLKKFNELMEQTAKPAAGSPG